MGLAMAHVSVQAQGIAANQLQLRVNQQILAQQQLYTESQAQQAQAEAASRTNVLVDMIRETRIDPVALEQHTQAQAVAEAHAVKHAQGSDVRFAEPFKELEGQLHASLFRRMRELLTAHMDQVEAEIRLVIATQGREIVKVVEKQFGEFQNQIAVQMHQVKSCAVRKAKSVVRGHHAEESKAHDAITASLLDEIAECKGSAVASAALQADEILHKFVSKQDAVPPVPVDQVSDFPVVQFLSDTVNVAAVDGESSTSSDDNVLSELKEGTFASLDGDILELL
ncbi:hypothetical protein V7S43_015951 [Phytophthora oleae]|uniref:Uncharacterized protein n=1 Tax=Phytophthora oleae TaxID=2107226 RepID=A0ABD3EXS4_9STRA